MKQMKKLLILALVLVLTLTFAACTQEKQPEKPTDGSATAAPTDSPTVPTEEDTTPVFDPAAAAPLIGDWHIDFFFHGADIGIEGFDADMVLPMVFHFGEDGTYTITLDREAAEESAKQFQNALKEHMVEMMYSEFTDQGLDREAADEAMQTRYQMTVEEFAAQSVEQMDLTSLFDTMNSAAANYYVQDGKLYTAQGGGDYDISDFTVSGDTLTLLNTTDETMWTDMGVTMPAKLTRK